jgi:hypothetical protein
LAQKKWTFEPDSFFAMQKETEFNASHAFKNFVSFLAKPAKH